MDLLNEELSLESEIENAVNELTQEELDSELDEDTLLSIVTNEIDGIDSLNARDLQVAIGEEITAENPSESNEGSEVDEVEEFNTQSETSKDLEESIGEEFDLETDTDLELEPSNEGVEALKKLLAALTNEDVAASMKGMKISINIELGDNK